MKISELDRELEAKNLAGLWSSKFSAHAPEPPYLWKWRDVYDGLVKAKDTVSIDLADRRVIRLMNPNCPTKTASRTLHFTFSIVNPGEVARAHRHTMAAIRFVVQGRGAYTTVDGERLPMEEGDLILTPNWTWHDHFNGSDKPIIWLDGLDGPLVQGFNAVLFEEYDKKTQPVTRRDGESAHRLGLARSPLINRHEPRALPFRYDWKEIYAALKIAAETEADPYDGVLLRYVNPLTGGFTLPTMSCEIQLLQPRKKTQVHRHTSTVLYHVFRGRGRTLVGENYLEWEKGDCFVLPLWQWHSHENLAADEAILFSMNDRPVMEPLGLYKEEKEGR
jgi:gentisate 1,2-dioxygenase